MDQSAPASAADQVKPAPDATDLSGRSLGEFQLLRRIGQGGMGQVYLAEQISLKRKVAVKIMRTDLAYNATFHQRFEAEAKAVARVNHANIVQVYAFGVENGLHFMALEYVEGRNLREYLAKKGTVETGLALSILRQVASALQRASELGIVHRDIKPENILLTRRGEVKVTDFGLSRIYTTDEPALNLTQTGIAMGTPLYMSPEQVQGLNVDPRTDIYSLGVTCYHMLSGKPPFRGNSAFELASHHVHTEPQHLSQVRPDLLPELCSLVHKMMAKRPEQRYQSCSELLKDLARLRDSLAMIKSQPAINAGMQPGPAGLESTPAVTPTAAVPTPIEVPPAQPTSAPSLTITLPHLSRHWVIGLAAATILASFLLGGLWSWLNNRPVRAAEPPPELVTTPEERQEQVLRAALEQDAEPTGDISLMRGITNRLDLGLFYLRQQRLDDADKVFTDLVNSRRWEYTVLGKLGRAMLLAYRNNPKESNRLFKELLADKRIGDRLDKVPVLYRSPQLHFEIARALEFNKANASPDAPFPSELERLRDPPKWPGQMPGAKIRIP